MKKAIAIICTLMACQSWAQTENNTHSKGKAIVLGRTYKIWSKELAEQRAINIYLPDDYSDTDTDRYPVIYLLDGGTDEDFIHVAGLIQFSTFPWVNKIPKSILVGVVNVDRKRDFTFPTSIKSDKEKYPTTGGSARFIAFLEKELQPYVQKHYRTSTNKMIIGESLGGLLATEILFEKPYLFDEYIIVSPSLWWDNGSLFKKPMNLSAVEPSANTDIYIAVGKEGLAPSVEPHVMEVDANVLADKIEALHNKHLDIYFDYLPNEDHASIMHQALLNAFEKLRSMHK